MTGCDSAGYFRIGEPHCRKIWSDPRGGGISVTLRRPTVFFRPLGEILLAAL